MPRKVRKGLDGEVQLNSGMEVSLGEHFRQRVSKGRELQIFEGLNQCDWKREKELEGRPFEIKQDWGRWAGVRPWRS